MGSIDNITLPCKAHILAFPYPAKGHINPLLHLCNRLVAKGFRITFITTTATFKSVQTRTSRNGINIECIEDEMENQDAVGELDDYFRKFRASASQGLRELIEKFKKSDYYNLPKVVIYDSTMPWILDVVHPMGVKGATFFTQSFAVCSVYYHMGVGTISVPFEKDIITRLPSMPPLEFDDLPGLQHFPDPNGIISRLLTDQFSNIEKVDYILFNTFEKLEIELATWMAKRWPIRTVGPTSPLAFSHKKSNDATNDQQENYLFETNKEACLKWLDQREPKSVVYVSFGSIAAPEKVQIEEVAEALLKIKCKFLWVVRSEEESKLPTSFKDDTSDQGLIINWCPQLDVLSHRAVVCFVTHCGWNSATEALSSGVPMIAMPQWIDQTTNAKFIADVWQVGIRVKVNEKGIVTRDEFERCIMDITEGEKGKGIRKNATKWKELAIEAVNEGGSSERNIDEFTTSLLNG